jgi:branched-chain amino acid transport system substrate-binding protein
MIKSLPVLIAALFVAATPAAAQAEKPLRIGVLTDMSGSYSAFSGKGSVLATQMALEDFQVSNGPLPFKVEILSADHQMKADVASSITRGWLDSGVDMIADVPNSAAALAVNFLVRGSKTVFIASGGENLTGKECSPNTVQWTFDLWSLAKGTASVVVQRGGDSWYFLTADYNGGHSVERFAIDFIKAAGGHVVGHSLPALGTNDYASYILQAQASGAKIVGLAMAGDDLTTALKQSAEFGLVAGGQSPAALVVFISEIHSLGLQAAQGLIYTTAFDWEGDEDKKTFAQRFAARNGGAYPSQIHAGVYSSTLHYLKAVLAAGTRDGPMVVAKMKEMPTDDPLFGHGEIRVDGRHLHPMYVVQVKRPEESHGPWDYLKVLSVIPAAEAVRPLEPGDCALGKKQ